MHKGRAESALKDREALHRWMEAWAGAGRGRNKSEKQASGRVKSLLQTGECEDTGAEGNSGTWVRQITRSLI